MLPRAAVRIWHTRPGLTPPRRLPVVPARPCVRPYAHNQAPPPPPPKDNPSPPNPTPSQKPLPDLRQGIPSTFAAELAKAEAQAARDSHGPNDPNALDEQPAAGSTGGRDGVELPKSAYETSTDRRRNRVANWSYLTLLLFGTTAVIFMGRNWESKEEELVHADAPNGWGFAQMYDRALARINRQKAYYTEPAFEKLLPDKDKMGEASPPLTLVLSLEDLLLHSEWTAKHGYRLAKRPGLDYFIRYLAGTYEIVIFTSVKRMDAEIIIHKLDPFHFAWPLFREHTRFENGEYTKDLSFLNRDLSKVIIIDTDPEHVKAQPENAIILPKWKGAPGDRGLIALIPFLEYIAMMSQAGAPIDVRQALRSMEGKDIPAEYARREAKLRAQHQRELAEQKKRSKGSAGGMFMKSLGLDASRQDRMFGDPSVTQGLAEGKMMIDIFRDMQKKNYEHVDKEIRENGAQWLKDEEETAKKELEANAQSVRAGALGWLSGAAPDTSSTPSETTAPNEGAASGLAK